MIERVSIEGGAEGTLVVLIDRRGGEARVGWKRVMTENS